MFATLAKFFTAKNNMWWFLLAFAFVGVILMMVGTFGYYVPNPKVNRPFWEQCVIFFFYFTIISNVMAIILPLLVIFGKFNQKSVHFQRFKIITVTSLSVTFFVYWVLLAKDASLDRAIDIVPTIFAHLVTPVLTVFVFIVNSHLTKVSEKNLDFKSTILFSIILPLGWLVFAFIFYAILGGATGHFDAADAIYSFLNLNTSTWYMIFVYVFAIAVIFIAFNICYIYFWRRDWAAIKKTINSQEKTK